MHTQSGIAPISIVRMVYVVLLSAKHIPAEAEPDLGSAAGTSCGARGTSCQNLQMAQNRPKTPLFSPLRLRRLTYPKVRHSLSRSFRYLVPVHVWDAKITLAFNMLYPLPPVFGILFILQRLVNGSKTSSSQ